MRVKLEDVCERGSSNIKQSDIIKMSGNYPIYGASGLAGKVNFYHQEQPYVAVVKDGAGIGRTTLNPAKSSVIGTMQYLIPKKNVLPEYLFYVVSYMHLEKYYTGATIPHIYFKDYKNEEFNLDNIEKQLEIIDVLGRCKKVIEARKQELVELDSLTKARFVEMFGDPIINSKNKDTQDLKDVLVLKAGDFTAASDISEEPTETNIYPCYGGNGIRGYVADYNQEGEYSLVGRQGALSGNVQYAEGKFRNTEHAVLVTPIIEMNSIWLNQLLINLDLKRYQTGAAQPGLSVKNLQEIPIIMVSIDEQNRYADFVKQVDKSKFDTMTFAPIYAIINLYLHTHFYQGRR